MERCHCGRGSSWQWHQFDRHRLQLLSSGDHSVSVGNNLNSQHFKSIVLGNDFSSTDDYQLTIGLANTGGTTFLRTKLGLSGNGSTNTEFIDCEVNTGNRFIPVYTTEADPPAPSLKTTSNDVSVSSAFPPLAGQVLTAVNSTTANWQTPVDNTTASNVGTSGVGVFKQKTANNLEFKSINNASNRISVIDDVTNNEVDIDVVEANLVHQNLSGVGAYDHAAIDAHIGASNVHGVTSAVVGTTDTQTLTNKTLNHLSNNLHANALRSATTSIDVATATAPTAGQVLTATTPTDATWQDIPESFPYYANEESLDPASTSGSTYQAKLTLTTANLAAGEYRIGYVLKIRNSSGGGDSSRYQIRWGTTVMEAGGSVDSSTNDECTESGFFYETLSGVNTFDIRYRALSGTTHIRGARLEIQRVA